jgi:hypothetical protein
MGNSNGNPLREKTMEMAALFGSSVGLVFGIGIGLIVAGLFLRGKGGPSNRASVIFGSNVSVNQNHINHHSNSGSAQAGDSPLSQAGNISSIIGLALSLIGLTLTLLQIAKIIV